jgi:hypothetical protein
VLQESLAWLLGSSRSTQLAPRHQDHSAILDAVVAGGNSSTPLLLMAERGEEPLRCLEAYAGSRNRRITWVLLGDGQVRWPPERQRLHSGNLSCCGAWPEPVLGQGYTRIRQRVHAGNSIHNSMARPPAIQHIFECALRIPQAVEFHSLSHVYVHARVGHSGVRWRTLSCCSSHSSAAAPGRLSAALDGGAAGQLAAAVGCRFAPAPYRSCLPSTLSSAHATDLALLPRREPLQRS